MQSSLTTVALFQTQQAYSTLAGGTRIAINSPTDMLLEIAEAISGKEYVPDRICDERDSFVGTVKARIAVCYCSDCLTWIVGITTMLHCHTVIRLYG